jgi:hypothetical protein
VFGSAEIAVAGREPFFDKFFDKSCELALERLVDELLEFGPVRLDELGDPSLDVDRDRPGHEGERRRRGAGVA